MIELFLMAVLAQAPDAERVFPTSGKVHAKIRGVSANHVTESSGDPADLEVSYYVCIFRDPESDRWAENWLVYKQCWDVNKETFDAVEECELFILKNAQIDEKAFSANKDSAVQREKDAKSIRERNYCK